MGPLVEPVNATEEGLVVPELCACAAGATVIAITNASAVTIVVRSLGASTARRLVHPSERATLCF